VVICATLAWLLLSPSLCGASGFEFAPCNDSASASQLNGTLCSSVAVPLRSQKPVSGGAPETLYLFVRKFPAAGTPRGTVWLIAGGPGESGATFYPFIKTLRRAFPNFDLLIPDHRGTGYSTHLCPTEEAIGSLGGGLLVGSEWSRCWKTLQSQPEYTRSFSISNASLDLTELIREYRGVQPVYLYGVSYGTQLILRALQLERVDVKGIIFDSLVPPESAGQWDLGHRAEIVNAVGMDFLRRCEQFETCRGHRTGTLTQAYSRLLETLAPELLQQIPSKNLPVFFGQLLGYPRLRRRIPQLIDELAQGKTAGLTATQHELDREIASLQQFPQSPLSIPLISVVSASENFVPSQTAANEQSLQRKGLLFATSFPTLLVEPQLPLYSRDRHFGASPVSLPRTLVIQGTLDSKTPFAAAVEHVQLLSKAGQISLTAAVDSPHFILMSAPDCFIAAVVKFRGGVDVGAPTQCARSLLSSQ
jgi:pimeloyl-ACP methyl ester carboxylesterase